MSNLELTYNGFLNRISEVSKKDVLLISLKKFIFSIAVFLTFAFVLIGLEAAIGFSAPVRKVLFYGYLSVVFATLVTIVIISLASFKSSKSESSIRKYAFRIGGFYPELKDNLLNAIQIYTYTKRKDHIFSDDLVVESINSVNEKARPFDFKKIITFSELKKPFIYFLSALIILVVSNLAFPNIFLSAASRLINYNYTFVENTLGIGFDVKPGNVEITKGESVEVLVKIMFNDPNYKTDEISLITKTVSDEGVELTSNSEKITASAINEFKSIINSVNSNTVYQFEYKGIKSSEYQITVTARPIIKGIKITVYPPAYTKLPVRTVEGTEITTIAGSRIYIELTSSENITRSFIQFTGGSSSPLEITGSNAAGSFTAVRNGTFRFGVVKDFNGRELASSNAQDYVLNVIPDEYPKISIIDPASDYSLKGEKEILVRSRITDDFGFTKLRIGYKISKTKYGAPDKDFRYADIPIQNADATGLEVPYVWNISKLNLGTDDEVEYFVEVYDNDGFSGPKMSKSDVRKLVFPSLESLLNKTEKSKDEIENSLKSAYEDAMDLKKEMDELKEKLDKNPEELGLNDPKKQQEMQNKIENIQNQFSNTEKKLDEMMQDLQNNNQISKETLEKYMELQKMFQRIDSKELRDMMKKLQEAMKNMNKDQLSEAMKNFKFDEENFKKSLEKTMELLNKVLNEQKFGELTQKLDELTKKQDALKNETKKTDEQDKNKMNDMSKSQDQLKKEYEEFQKQMKELSDKMNQQQKDKMSKEMEKMLSDMMKKKLEQKMNDASQKLQDSKKNSAQDKQEEISQDMKDMNQQMQDMLQDMLNAENDKLQAKMQSIIQNLKELSEKQQELKDETEKIKDENDEHKFKEKKDKQQGLGKKLSKTIDEVMSLSEQMGPNPMLGKNLGDAYNNMNDASEQLGNMDGKGANKSQGNAKDALDQAISKLEQMSQSGKMGKGKQGSGLQQLLQALQQMIAKQQGLNQKMGQFGQNGNQGNMTQEQMAEMQRLSMEQSTIQKNMQQLNEEYKKQQELEGKKMLGNLDEVQKDMLEVIKDLENNNVTPETKKRQEKILSRMLDFQLSQREKDFEQKRESRPGKNFERSSPPEIVISRPNIINGVNQDAVDIQKENFSDDYEVLIQKYMERMKQAGNVK